MLECRSPNRQREHEMKKNMGDMDRKIRGFVVAPILLVVALVVGLGSVGGVIAVVLAAVMAGTAAVGTCPLYLPFHLSTNHRMQTDH
jgi:heme/copper-type cytochrome/quinol oxidase subunit 4